MLNAILVALTTLGQILSLVNRVLDARKEKDEAIKKKKTEALQSGTRAIVDGDVSRLNSAIDKLNRLRK